MLNLLFYLFVCFGGETSSYRIERKNTFELALSILPYYRFVLPTFELNYERRLSKQFSVNFEGKTFLLLPLPFVEVGTRFYPFSDFKGLYIYGGSEVLIPNNIKIYAINFTNVLSFRFPFAFGYKIIFSNGFTVNPFMCLSVDFERVRVKGYDGVGIFEFYSEITTDEIIKEINRNPNSNRVYWVGRSTPFVSIYLGYSW